MDKLLNCPFCGFSESDIVTYSNFTKPRYAVMCSYCGAYSGIKDTKKETVKNWNMRALTINDFTTENPTPANVQKLNNVNASPVLVQKLKNEHGAGRKPKITEEIKECVIRFRYLTMREIAKHCNISVGSVHKIISEHRRQHSKTRYMP